MDGPAEVFGNARPQISSTGDRVGPDFFVRGHCHAEIQWSDKCRQRKDASVRLCPMEGR